VMHVVVLPCVLIVVVLPTRIRDASSRFHATSSEFRRGTAYGIGNDTALSDWVIMAPRSAGCATRKIASVVVRFTPT